MGRLLGDHRDGLDARRSRADDRDALAGERDRVMWPAAGEMDLALEIADAVDLRRLGRGQAAARHDVGAAGHRRAGAGREQPALRGLVPRSRCHLGAEANVAPQVVAVGDETEVAQNFRLGGVFFRPLPRALQLRIEGVAVIGGLDVATRTGIAVPVPGAADIAGRIQSHDGKACPAQAMEKVQAGKAGTDHGDVDVLHTGVDRLRSTCVWHGAPPTAFCLGGTDGLQAHYARLCRRRRCWLCA